MVLALAGIAALAIEALHNFIWFGARSKRAEAKTNLRRLCLAQRALMDAGRPSSTWRGLDTALERYNRYAYFVAPGGSIELRPDDHRPETPDLAATAVQVDPHVFVDPKLGPQVVVSEADVPSSLLGELKLGSNGECPRCTWAMVAIGNIDIDPELDVVSVATSARVTQSGEPIDSCVPFLEHDDLPLGPVRRLFR